MWAVSPTGTIIEDGRSSRWFSAERVNRAAFCRVWAQVMVDDMRIKDDRDLLLLQMSSNPTDGDGCWQRARCGKTIAIVCWRGAQCRFLIATGGGSRAEQWIRCMGGVRR